MAEESLPPLFPQDPNLTGEPVQLTEEELAAAADACVVNLARLRQRLTDYVSWGAMSHGAAEAAYGEVEGSLLQKLALMHAGHWVPNPDRQVMQQNCIAETEVALEELRLFDHLSGIAVNAGMMSEAEQAARRQALIAHRIDSLDEHDG